jgi:hypothetical protein
MYWPAVGTGPPQWEVGDKPPKPWHGHDNELRIERQEMIGSYLTKRSGVFRAEYQTKDSSNTKLDYNQKNKLQFERMTK